MSESTNESRYPKPGYAWFMVVLLTIAYMLSYIDRYIMGLLVEPIKADLALTDTQVGLLMGLAFGLVYAVFGLPFGWLADHKRRTFVVAAGITIWSAATAATGLAKSFFSLFLARMTVGIGEASLSPSAMSMIKDSFAPDRRGKPIAFYTMALSLGSGIASLIAAVVLTWAKSIPEIKLPVVGVIEPWQLVFIVFGVPGLLLALVFLLAKEPPRQVEKTVNEKSGPAAMFKFVGENRLPFFGIVVLAGAMIVVAYSHGWLAATFERTWGWSAEKYSAINGVILLVVGPATVFFAGWLSDLLYQRGRAEAPYLILLAGVAILVPSGVLATLMSNAYVAIGILGITTFGIALASAVGVTSLLNITPSNISAQVVALYYMLVSLAGAILGPAAPALLSDYVFGNDKLNWAVSCVPLIFGVPALIFGWYAKRAYVEKLAELGGTKT